MMRRRWSVQDPGRGEAIGESEAFLDFQEQLSQVAEVDRPVLLIGERGTGKELAASRLHYLSKRWQGPLVALNCAALSPSLIEAELFGYEAGAFTGALRRRRGRFEAADEGTVFLDEIAGIPMEVQEKILRVVEYHAFERVGSVDVVHVDVRIIGATNVHLPTLVDQGRFKQDLLDRLSFEVLFLPPLRDREGDIALLARHFAARMAFELGRDEVPEFSTEAMRTLESYGWPGNVRELKNVIERAVYRAKRPRITRITFDPFHADRGGTHNRSTGRDAAEKEIPSLPTAVKELQIRLIKRALKTAHYNQRRAAELLGLTYHQLRGLLRKYARDLEDDGN
jgi:psp operon transcriptional activator